MDLNSHHSRHLIVDLPIKTRKWWQNNHNFEFLLVFVGPADPLHQCFRYRIFNWNEELVFDVDELFWVVNQLNIGL